MSYNRKNIHKAHGNTSNALGRGPTLQPDQGISRFAHQYLGQESCQTGNVNSESRNRSENTFISSPSQTKFKQSHNRPIVNTEAGDAVTPIRQLALYINQWVIIARCTAKTEIKTFTNQFGESQVFSFDVLDRDCGEIRCTAFGSAVNMFYDIVQIGSIYKISKGNLVKKNKFCHLDNEHEIRLDLSSKVEEVSEHEAPTDIPFIHFNFTTIEAIKEMNVNSIVDVIGILESAEKIRMVTLKKGDEVPAKNIAIKDHTGFAVDVSLWKDHATETGKSIDEAIEHGGLTIVAAKAVRVTEFNGINLNTLPISVVQLNPDCPESHRLRQWANMYGDTTEVQTLRKPILTKDRKRSVLEDVSANTPQEEKPSIHTVCATVVYIKSNNMYYAACPLQRNDRNCLKKLIGEENNYSCETCGQDIDEPCWRYILNLAIRDHTDSRYATAFDTGEGIMCGVSAEALKSLQDTPEFAARFENARYKTHILTLKTFVDNWNGEYRIKSTIMRQEELNLEAETKRLLDEIDQFNPSSGSGGTSKQFSNQEASMNRGYQGRHMLTTPTDARHGYFSHGN